MYMFCISFRFSCAVFFAVPCCCFLFFAFRGSEEATKQALLSHVRNRSDGTGKGVENNKMNQINFPRIPQLLATSTHVCSRSIVPLHEPRDRNSTAGLQLFATHAMAIIHRTCNMNEDNTWKRILKSRTQDQFLLYPIIATRAWSFFTVLHRPIRNCTALYPKQYDRYISTSTFTNPPNICWTCMAMVHCSCLFATHTLS